MYKLVSYPMNVLRTDQWNPRTVPEVVWRVEGPGVDRPATDIEVAIVQSTITRALASVKRFDDVVNCKTVSGEPGTPTEAMRKEFGI